MAAPTVSMHFNTNTEGSPTWNEIGSGDTLYFTGPDSVSGTMDPVTAPASGFVIAEEMWEGNGSHTECDTVYDGTVNTNQYVLALYFATNATSTAPILTYYDSDSHGADPSDEIATGTAETDSTGWIKAIETTHAAPGAAWCNESTGSAGAATTNCLDGDQRYVQCSEAASADNYKYFNIVCYVPYDATAGTAGHDGVLTCKYTYT